MIFNNLFLFILPGLCATSALPSPFLWAEQSQRTAIDWSIWNGKEVSIVGCTVCKYVLTLLLFEIRRSIDPQDYRWTLTAKRSSLFLSCRLLEGEETSSTSWCNFQWVRNKKGRKRFIFSWLPVGSLWSTLKIDFARSIELKFIWYWMKVKIFSFLALASAYFCLDESFVAD